MSIINDALNKAQNLRNKNDTKKSPLAPIKSELSTRVPATQWVSPMVIFILILLAGFIAMNLIPLATLKAPKEKKTKEVTERGLNIAPSSKITDTSTLPKAGHQTKIIKKSQTKVTLGEKVPLSLDGILYDENNPDNSYAVLSGYILKKGDSVKKTKLLLIEPDAVTVLLDGKEIILRIK